MENFEKMDTPEISEDVGLNSAVMNMLSGTNVTSTETSDDTTSEDESITEKAEIAGDVAEVTVGAADVKEKTSTKSTKPTKAEGKKRGRKPKDGIAATAKPVKEVKVLDPEVADLVKLGRKGVTNAQMIPAIRNAIDAKDSDKLAILERHFPSVYDSSLKYISGKRKEELKHLVNQ